MIKLLLIEDNPGDITMFKMVIEDLCLQVELLVAGNGTEVIELLSDDSKELPDLMFLDLKLTKISGMEILAEIKSHQKLKTIPVIILTSSSYEKDIYTCYALGANSFIYKVSDYHEFKYYLKSSIEYFCY